SSLRMIGTGAQDPVWHLLGGLHMPVLVVTGDGDTKFSVLGDRLAVEIGANAARARIAAGHAVPWEEPEQFAENIHRWLATTAG
ncbi:MAG: alpha/beta fold hydrolase, partial [Acidimicrobiales bacterium]